MTREELEKARLGPIQYQELEPHLAEWARNLHERVGHLLYPTFEQWKLGLMREAQPHREMLLWEAIARAFEAWLIDHPDSDQKEVIGNFLVISMQRTFMGELTEERALWHRICNDMNKDVGATLQRIFEPLGFSIEVGDADV